MLIFLLSRMAGGKGGVGRLLVQIYSVWIGLNNPLLGKTTTSCSLAIQLAQCRESVLLIVRPIWRVSEIPLTVMNVSLPSQLIRHTISRTHLGRNFPRMQQKWMALIIFLLWKSTQQAQYKKWSSNVRLHLLPLPLRNTKLTMTLQLIRMAWWDLWCKT